MLSKHKMWDKIFGKKHNILCIQQKKAPSKGKQK